jgi:hypothetical protein
MEYDFSAFSGDTAINGMGDMGGTASVASGGIGEMGGMGNMGGMGSTASFGGGGSGGTGGFGDGMGGGTNSFGPSYPGSGGGMSGEDLNELFESGPWGGLSAVGITNFEQIFRGNSGGNLQRGENPVGGGGTMSNSTGEDISSSGVNNLPSVGEEDPLLASGGSNTSANPYVYNFPW